MFVGGCEEMQRLRGCGCGTRKGSQVEWVMIGMEQRLIFEVERETRHSI